MNKLFLIAALSFGVPAAATSEWVAGEVEVDPARSKVTLKHAPIKSVKMAAMTMPFKVKDAALLVALKVGDKVRFEVFEHDGERLVRQIEVRP